MGRREEGLKLIRIGHIRFIYTGSYQGNPPATKKLSIFGAFDLFQIFLDNISINPAQPRIAQICLDAIASPAPTPVSQSVSGSVIDSFSISELCELVPIRLLRCWGTEQSSIVLFCLRVVELQSSKLCVCMIVWAGAKQSRSPGAEQTSHQCHQSWEGS